MDEMPRPRPPYLHRETTRHGAVVWTVRRKHGRRVRLHAKFGTSEFWEEYRAALAGAPLPAKVVKAKPMTLRWALDKYRASPAWVNELKQATRKQRENIYRAVITKAGDALLSEITQETIVESRDARAKVPHSANNFLKAMRGFFAWACSVDGGHIVKVDPTKGVKLLKGANDDIGFHTWTEDELTRFEARWPLGTRERLAFDILLYTGLRRGDAVTLGKQHMKEAGWIRMRMEKTEKTVEMPVLQPLADSIAATKTGDLTLLVTERGVSFVKEGFGNWFREVCDKAGCSGSAHGLRKAGATRAANNGASERELMALYGWETNKMAADYTKTANQRLLARSAGAKLLSAQTENEKRPHLKSGKGVSAKSLSKSGG